jgi:hypothetical protein
VDNAPTEEYHTALNPYCPNLGCPFCHTNVEYHAQVQAGGYHTEETLTATYEDALSILSIVVI